LRLAVFLMFSLLVPALSSQSQPTSSNPQSAQESSHRVKVAPEIAVTLLVQKGPPLYPDAALKAGIQGSVVLRVVTSYSGEVKEVSVISGDPALTQNAVDAVKQWKYRPYLADGSPAEMETEVTLGFHIKAPTPAEPAPLGTFHENAYFNDYFGIYYPLSRDWVRETDLMRSKAAADGKAAGPSVLLAAVHIPVDSEPLRADSSFTVFALPMKAMSAGNCTEYLEGLTTSIQSQKQGEPKGDLSQFTVAGHDFYRRDFHFKKGTDHRTFVCTINKGYLLQWNLEGWSKEAIETAVATLQSITPSAPASQLVPVPPPQQEKSALPARVRVSSGVSTGLLIKKVQPIYPPDARYNGIQGSVVMHAVINKAGDVIDLEVISGPIELAVSAVNAVRKWKYRPYLLKGDPVEVDTQIVVNYTLSR
jgi:TonB family protein